MRARGLWALAVGVALFGLEAGAAAEVTHVVQRGHTIEAIAHRYHVTVKAIVDANHLKDSRHLKPGQTLIIPGVDGPKKKGAHDKPETPLAHATPAHAPAPAAAAAPEQLAEPRGRGESDAVHAIRLGEDFHIRVKDAHGRIPPTALKAFERMMRQGHAQHPVDPRLIALVSIVSNHFEGKPIEVVSGFRPYTATQYVPHSNHNYGKALDFRIRGVKNEAVRDFCRTLRSAGCGYYPNSTFVHLDVRDAKAYWVDWSRAGEPPKYDKPGVAADEGTGDVPDEETPTESPRAEPTAQ